MLSASLNCTAMTSVVLCLPVFCFSILTLSTVANLSHREAAWFKVRLRHHNRAIIGVFPLRADGDFDPLTEGGQEPEEAVNGVAFNAATHERGHLRLVEPEQVRRPPLA